MEQAPLAYDLVTLHRHGAWDASAALLYTIDPDFRIVTANAAWKRFTSSNQSEPLLRQRLEGANLLEAMREPWRSETEAVCRAIFAGHVPQHEAEHDYSTPDQLCILHTVVTPLVNAQDEIIGATFTSHDFTARRTLEQELSQQGAQLDVLGTELQRIQQIAMQLIADTDPRASLHVIMKAIFEAIPQAAHALLVLDHESDRFVPLPVELPHALDLDAVGGLLPPLLGGLRANRGQVDIVGYSNIGTALGKVIGGVRAVWLQPLRGRHGQLLGSFVCTWPEPYRPSALVHQLLNVYATYAALAIENASLYAAEVVARRKAEEIEQIATSSNAQLTATLQAMVDSVIVCDRHGQIVLANEPTSRLFPSTAGSLGPGITQLPDQLGLEPPFEQLGLDQAVQDHIVQGESALPYEDGERILQIESRPVRAGDGTVLGAVAVVHDATAERLAQRLKEEFLSVAAHELKTPVTTLKGYAQLTLKRIGGMQDMEMVRRSLQMIDEQADRITRLVSQLLDVSSIHAGRLELDISRFNVAEVVSAVVQAEQHKTPGPPVSVSGVPTAWVDADLARIEQAIRKVLRSIRKFADESNTIAIHVARGPMIGITLAEQRSGEREVEPALARERPAATGSGGMSLGLQIMQAIIERHQGELRIEGGNGQPLLIHLTLPATHGTGLLLPSSDE